MCNDSAWITDRVWDYFNSSRDAHMNIELAVMSCVYSPSLIFIGSWSLREELAAGRSPSSDRHNGTILDYLSLLNGQLIPR